MSDLVLDLKLDIVKKEDPTIRFQYHLDKGLIAGDILAIACACSNTQWCEAALKAGAHPNGEGWDARKPYWDIDYTPLCIAVKFRAHSCIVLLYKWGAALDVVYGYSQESAMSIALGKKDYSTVELLLQLGAHTRNGSQEPWITAAARISVGMAELFLDYGATQEDMDPHVWTTEIGQMVHRRRLCKASATALYCVLRKRYRLVTPGGKYKFPKEIVQQIAEGVWDLRKESEWLPE